MTMNQNEFVRLEQTKTLYEHLPYILLGSLGISGIAVFWLWNRQPEPNVYYWGLATVFLAFLRLCLYLRFRASTIVIGNSQIWLTWMVSGTFLAGILWGLLPILFYSSSDHVSNMVILTLTAGYIASASASTALFFPIFCAFCLPASIPMIFITYLHGGLLNMVLSFSMLFFVVMSFGFAKNLEKAFVQTKALIFENMLLLEKLSDEKDKAESAIREKNKFLATASHDLRQPLHALGLFVEALKPHLHDSRSKHILGKLTQSTDSLNTLLNGLLDISKLDAKTIKYSPENVNLKELVLKLEAGFEKQARLRNNTLEVNVEGDVFAFIDKVLIERVLNNLIENALLYTNDGKVIVSMAPNDENILLSVVDTGIGIPDDEKESIFADFYQIDNPERNRQKGMGLGLSIVMRLCQLMSIDISLHSEVGIGTTFMLTIEQGTEVNTHQHPPTKIAQQNSMHIVVIDDERDILEGMGELLTLHGLDVTLAESGEEAIQRLTDSSLQPELIIADLRLKNNESGLQVIEKIRDEYNTFIPSILVTGETLPDQIKLAESTGVSVLYKPVNGDQLLTSIRILQLKPALSSGSTKGPKIQTGPSVAV